MNTNRVPFFNVVFGAISTFDTLPSPKPKAPQELRATFPHKIAMSLELIRPKKGKLATASFHLTPNQRRRLALSKINARTLKIAGKCLSYVSA